MDKVLFIFELVGTLLDFENRNEKTEVSPFIMSDDSLHKIPADKFRLYPDARNILQKISDANYSIGFTTTTNNPSVPRNIIELLDIQKYADITAFNLLEKREQVELLSSQSGIPLHEIIYFDASGKNVDSVKSMGIKTFLIPDEGLTMDTFMVSMRNASLSLDLERLQITWGNRN